MPFEQTTDKLKESIPAIDGDNIKEHAFGLFDSIKPMLSFIFHFFIDLAKTMFEIFSKTLRRKYD